MQVQCLQQLTVPVLRRAYRHADRVFVVGCSHDVRNQQKLRQVTGLPGREGLEPG